MPHVAVGRRAVLQVFGDDHNTRDGTGERDYIHVAAVERIGARAHFEAINIGCGAAATVMELVQEFRAASGAEVPIEIGERRSGAIPAFWADAGMAQRKLGWRASSSLHNMCLDTWRWQSRNPNGFEKTQLDQADRQVHLPLCRNREQFLG